jgi:hypothetical protein
MSYSGGLQVLQLFSAMRSLRIFVLEPIAKPSYVAARMLYKVLGKLATTLMKLVGVFLLMNICITLRY